MQISSSQLSAWGDLYAITSDKFETPPNFPVEFAEIPAVTKSIERLDGFNFWMSSSNFENNSIQRAASFDLIRPTSFIGDVKLRVNIIAIGKWK